jgi:hypothetical protein
VDPIILLLFLFLEYFKFEIRLSNDFLIADFIREPDQDDESPTLEQSRRIEWRMAARQVLRIPNEI